ncbi:hypothetical protein HMJ29_02055 [Hymenobacter taeanensis]|uniref:Glycosyltransferase RgtA/B/C/D-like domain-containing protein n=1 Tax=Hymenobacter taeanensis TaxID=2735321 RepID=A0A6M6BCX8_9BACT|nr:MULTISPECIES: hypothetical protein [Hymenobacter]QJX45780.1 hypothetical protein HMJ29_02055 [Hymenobacter taeanensis]UOQ79623.1 hypothetical protein MUN83_12265 [Hymenobacter sp. 5414T-23]
MAATKNDIPYANLNLWWLLALAVLAALRLYGLREAALPDYDSVRNWQIVQEVAYGKLSHVFHHGSPGFYLLYAPLAWVTSKYQVYQYVNALLAVAALGMLIRFVGHQAHLSGPQQALLTLFAGTSVLLTFSGRDFTMSSGSLFCFAGLLEAYWRRLQQPGRQTLLWATAWLMVGLCINYKFILTLPILAVLELWQNDELLWHRGNLVRVVALLAAPYLVLGAVGVAAGLRWYLWPAFYYKVAFPDAANAAGRSNTLRFDGLYYFRYLWDFESPLLGVGIGLLVLKMRKKWPSRRGQLPVAFYLLMWAACLLAGMTLLIKAPRGLLWAYPLFYVLAFLGLRQWLANRVLLLVALAAIVFNCYRLQREIYAYTPTRYPQVAAWLQAHEGGKVASTVSLGLAPFQPDSVLAITDEHTLAALRHRGYRYVLLDSYWRVTGVAHFDSLRQQQPVAAWPEPLLTSPLLFLEHSEYTGLGYAETLARQHVAKQDTLQLRLLKL